MEFDKLNAELASLHAEKIAVEVDDEIVQMYLDEAQQDRIDGYYANDDAKPAIFEDYVIHRQLATINKPKEIVIETNSGSAILDFSWDETKEALTSLDEDFMCNDAAQITLTTSDNELDHIVSSLKYSGTAAAANPIYVFETTTDAVGKIREGGWDSETPTAWTEQNTIPTMEWNSIYCEPKYALQLFNANQELVVAIRDDTGEVTLGKDVSPEVAAHEFWHRLANCGGNFEQRLEDLQSELVEIEQELSDERDQRIELQEIVNDIANALGVPEVSEYDIADYAAMLKAKVDDEMTRLDVQEEDPAVAYERAMKIVR